MDLDINVTPDIQLQLDNLSQNWPDIQDQIDRAREKAAAAAASMADSRIQDDIQDKVAAANEKAAQAYAKSAEVYARSADKFNFNLDFNKNFAMQQARGFSFGGPRGSDDGVYNNGLRAIDDHQYEQALSSFNTVVSRAGVRAEGALYWKAYVLNKLGRTAEAQAAIDTLRKSYPNSRWLDDAKALELEVKQTKGPVSPEGENDDDMKLLALNGLMQSDPEKALPLVQNLLKGSHSPKLKRNALYVIAESGTPQAQQLLVQIARGGNPDLQVRAIQYMSEKRNPDTPKTLLEIYTSTNDPAVKRAILDAFSNNRDKGRLLTAVRGEKDLTLREQGFRDLGRTDGQPELWQIYQGETTSDGKIAVLNAMYQNGNLDKLTEVARTDKDPKVRQKAIEVIASQESGTPSATLVSLYSGEQDEHVKNTIIDHLSARRNGDCKPLVDVARSEKDIKLKMRLVERLSGMTRSCQAATDYLQEILSR
ncbi:MAG TPA: hypothetical protein VMB03_03520 [Bryobacteraceae bacterium]|nr:hypothetical protein [Bryobacteraceae bacterium]